MSMQIRQIEITCGQLADGFVNNEEDGVVAFGGKLNVRPPYQREFIYGEKERNAVITTIYNGYPLNVMYWADCGDGKYEIIDGQQRTMSICQYINGDFPYFFKFFENVTDSEERRRVLEYKLTVYVCSGTDTDKLKWFETINIAGKQLTKQELLNAVYSGSFVTDAKRYFSKTGCVAYKIGGADLLNGSANRQEYLETALKWITHSQGLKDIRQYMAIHQHDTDALELYNYFHSVMTWVHGKFDVKKRKTIMKGVDWGRLYERFHHDKTLDKNDIEKEISVLVKDSEVGKKSGICEYVLTRDERCLGLRTFGDDIRESVYEKQNGVCPLCKEHFDIKEMEADHIIPWSKGGKTIEGNCQMLCMKCNRTKSGK